MLGVVLRFLVSLACVQVIQLSKLVLAVSISSISIVTPLVLSFSSLIALRFVCPNLLCASSIVFLLNTIFSPLEVLESVLDSGLDSRLDSRSKLLSNYRLLSGSLLEPRSKLVLSSASGSTRSRSLSRELLSNSSRLCMYLK